ncbi:MAG: hypothetical protein WCA46_14080 [Actinocatenispora sp.]
MSWAERLGWQGPVISKKRDLLAIATDALELLQAEARKNRLHATGRQSWLNKNRDAVKVAVITPLLVKSEPQRSYRCRVVVLGDYSPSVWFTLDIPIRRYRSLHRSRDENLLALAEVLAENSVHLTPEENG